MSIHFVKLSYRSVTLLFSTERENYVHPWHDTVYAGAHSLRRDTVLSLDGVWGGGGSWSCVKPACQTLLTLRGKTYPFWGVGGGWEAGEGEAGATGVDMQNEKYFLNKKEDHCRRQPWNSLTDWIPSSEDISSASMLYSHPVFSLDSLFLGYCSWPV